MKNNNKITFLFMAGLLCAQMPGGARAAEQAPEDQDIPKVGAVEPAKPADDDGSVVRPSATVDAGKDDGSVRYGFAGSYLSGLFARSSGDIQESIRFLRKVYKQNPANTEVSSQLQGMLLLDGQIDEAQALAATIHASNAKDPISDLLLALRAIKKNNSEEAANILDAAFESSGQLWQPLISAWLDINRNKMEKPLRLEELSVNVGRAAPLANYHLALINNQAGFKDEAAANFKNAVEDSQNPPAHIMEALLSFYKQNNEPAILTPVVTSYREANPASELHGDMPLAATLQEGVSEVLFTMGSVMLEADVTQDATIYLRLALYLRPDFDVAALTLGDAYSELSQYERANAVYKGIATTSRLYSAAQLRVAMNLDRMDKPDEAIAQLDRMDKHTPGGYEALVAKGDLLRVHSRFAEAAEAYGQALKRIAAPDVRHWPIFFARGACYERIGKWEQAETDLQQALTLKPDQPEVLNYLGYSWLTRGEKLTDARDMLQKAIKLRPNDPQIIDSLGWAFYLLGEYDQATEQLEKAVQLMPGDATTNDHLGDTYWRQGRKTEARFQWERSLTFAPEAAEAESIRKKLKDGLPSVAVSLKPPVVASRQPESPVTP